MDLRIHLVPGETLRRYQPKRLYNFQINSLLMRLDHWLPENGVSDFDQHDTDAEWFAFHGWKRPMCTLDAAEADALRALRTGRNAPDAGIAAQLWRRFEELRWTHDETVDLRAVTIRALVDFAALQNPWELEQLLMRVATLRPRSILEIGTSAGGLLYALAQVADPNATFISVDIPHPDDRPETTKAVTALARTLVRPSQRLYQVHHPSSHYSVLAEVRSLLREPLDLLVIDGDHSYGAVRADFEMYSPLVRPGGLVALHDVMVTPANSGRGFDVGMYWPELQRERATEMLVDPQGVPGIVMQFDTPPHERRPVAFGFGLVTA